MKNYYLVLLLIAGILATTNLSAQLSGCYQESNWTIDTDNTGPNTLEPGVVFNNDAQTITFTADGDFQGVSGTSHPAGIPFDCSVDDGLVMACIEIPADGTVSFDWHYTMQLFFEDPGNEPFGYCLNGSDFVSLVTAGQWNEQSGTATIPVSAGDQLCLVQASYFSEEFQAVTTVSNFIAPACPVLPTLRDCYGPENWTANTENTNGSVTITETSIVINGDTDFSGTNLDEIDCSAADGMVTVCITAPATGDIIFDWNIDGGPFFNPLVDKFGYCLNGFSTELTSINPPPFGTSNGTDTISVIAGDELCFVYASKFADGFGAPATINNFILPQCPPPPPLIDCYAAENWMINTDSTSGSVEITETSIVINGDTDFSGTNLDEIDCGATNGMVTVCITAPATGDIIFDWNIDGGPFFNPLVDKFGYRLNGFSTELTSINPPPFGTSSGTDTISVVAGDELCFVYASKFADGFGAPATINNFILPQCPPPPPLIDCYAAENWMINTDSTSGSVEITETSIVINGDTDFSGTNLDEIDCGATNGMVTVCITAPATGEIIFDWNIDGGPFFNPLVDKFGYCLNGFSTELTSINPPPFGTSSGTDTISVIAGDELCFVYASKFADGFGAPATINNFILPQCPPPPPLIDCYAAENWMINTDSTSGSVEITETSIVINGDTDFSGTNLDEIDCGATNGMVTVCITAPATGDIIFDWNIDGGPFFNPLVDKFGYCLNGFSTELTSINPPPFGTSSGTDTISVIAGDELCFVYASKFADGFGAPVTIDNFILPQCPPPPPLIDCYAAENWMINTDSTSGSVEITETSIVINGDTDFSGTNLDEIDCGATNGMVTVCITAPATGDIIFDWNIDGGPFFNPLVDKFGYCLNGFSTELTSINPPPFGTSSGTDTISVIAGDELCFVYASKFADGFGAPATIDNFVLPQCPPPPPISVSVSVSNEILCHGDSTGMITVEAIGGVPDYTYTWDSELASGSMPSNLPAGNYCVTVTDTENNMSTACIELTQPEALTLFLSSNPETDGNADGSAITTVGGGTTPYTYLWNTNPVQTTGVAVGLSTGTYTVTVTDDNGCTIVDSVFVDQMTGLNEITGLTLFELYPNPTSGQVNLNLELEQASDIMVDLYNSVGQRVFRKEFKDQSLINYQNDWSNLPSGIYWITVRVRNENLTHRLIIQKEK